MNDYERVASVIRYLDLNHTAQPDLNELAQGAGLSPFHFHRLFSAWAGVTPKDFLQCLTLEHVKTRLRNGESVLDAALNTGLSGPGRLHDLCVSLEAVSPGEMKNGGADLDITFGLATTPFGQALIAETPRGICHLSFPEKKSASPLDLLREQWPHAQFHRDDDRVRKVAEDIFAKEKPKGNRLTLRAFVRGTPFQVRVWRALLRVPSGSLISYGRLAAAVGLPRAARAVGSAVGANPLAFIIPCHRVIRETGALGNYRWDPIRKRAIIGWEASGRSSDYSELIPAASGF